MNKIREALEYLDGGGLWIKGDFEGPDGTCCLLGALDVVGAEILGREESAVEDTIREQYPDRFNPYGNLRPVAMFNDDLRTTWLDAERVMKKAAMKLDELV